MQTTLVAANFAAVYKHNFPYMHCWNIMKYEPKWQDPKPRSVTKSSAWPLAWRRARCRDWSVSKPRPPPNTPSSSGREQRRKRPLGSPKAAEGERRPAPPKSSLSWPRARRRRRRTGRRGLVGGRRRQERGAGAKLCCWPATALHCRTIWACRRSNGPSI